MKPGIRAVIVDDEELARENLRLLLEDLCPWVEVVGVAESATTAKQRIAELDPDLVFLDIRMPSGTEGLDLILAYPDPRFVVVFVTAFKDHAVQAFHANAVDYLLKPIDPDELLAAMDKVAQRTASTQGSSAGRSAYANALQNTVRHALVPSGQLVIDHARGFKLFRIDTIIHLCAEGNCTRIHFTDGSRYLDTRTLGVYEELLKDGTFMRTHRSHMINLAHMAEYLRDDGHWAVMSDGTRIRIARDRVEGLLANIR